MNIDRVARGMTAGGPKPGFIARVMAPIHGRPRPGFTARVMNRIDGPDAQAAQAFRPAFARAFKPALAALALVVIAAGVMIARGDAPVMPAAPQAPVLTAAPYARAPLGAPPLAPDNGTVRTIPRVRVSQPPQIAEVLPEAPPIYTIAPLSGPASIDLKAISPEAVVVTPLEWPAPLKINEIKEKS